MEQRRYERVALDAVAMFDVDHRDERGFTLIELVVLVGIVAIAVALGCESLAARPAAQRSTAVEFAAFVAQARAVAAVTGGDDGSGATIGVVRRGDVTLATLYRYRPILGARDQPTQILTIAPLRTATTVEIAAGDTEVQPPFALFFSASGHVSVAAPFSVGSDAPLAAEPTCPLGTGIAIDFNDGVHAAAHPLSCELGRLDVETTLALHAHN